jgi:sulfur relay (sulfurtransferase) complex TusBCD TusD component (DsrE family)
MIFPPYCWDCGRSADQVELIGTVILVSGGEDGTVEVALCAQCRNERGIEDEIETRLEGRAE